jgi:S1-C subfamily serine protease
MYVEVISIQKIHKIKLDTTKMSTQVKSGSEVRYESSLPDGGASDVPHNFCPPPRVAPLFPEQILCQARDAVVQIHSEFILTTYDTQVLTSGTPISEFVVQSTQVRENINHEDQSYIRRDVIVEGNGFFIDCHFIVAPAHLVLLPPSITSSANRYPYYRAQPINGQSRIQNEMIRASRILISVFNVNGSRHSFVYEADLVGVDGAGDIAVLKINSKRQWNLSNPSIESRHPSLSWGSSRGTTVGSPVYLIGDNQGDTNGYVFNAVGGITEGLLSSNRHNDYSGGAFAELIRISVPCDPMISGCPILDAQGKVIGMQTGPQPELIELVEEEPPEEDPVVPAVPYSRRLVPRPLLQRTNHGTVFGPSQFFMKRVITALIRGSSSKYRESHLRVINDPLGCYYRYVKGYLGLAYDVFTGVMYDYTMDYTSGDTQSGIPRIRLDGSGNFINQPSCKELIGLRVLGLAGLNPDDACGVDGGLFFVPGGDNVVTPLADNLPVSPLLGKLEPGDVITHINGCPLGDIDSQIALSLITWRLKCGDQIEVIFRKGGQVKNGEDQLIDDGYENLRICYFCINDIMPAVLDYPWYAVNRFPFVYDTLPLPVPQQAVPAYPALLVNCGPGTVGTQFRAAI